MLACSGLLLLVAFEGFGHLNMTIERSSSSFLTVSFHPDMGVIEHPALFFVLSTVLSGLAWISIIPLNNIITCLVYCVLFGFISSKAMIGWAFPLSLAEDSFTHQIFAFPFAYVFISKFLLTFVAVWNPQLNPQQSRGLFGGSGSSTISPSSTSSGETATLSQAALVFACATPFFGLLWAMSANVYPQAHSGIEWSAVVGFSSLCITTRLRELYSETNAGKGGKPHAYSDQEFDSSVCLPCAALTIFWTTFAVLTSHGLDRDVFVPLSSLTLLCTTPGAVLKHTPPVMAMGIFCAVFWLISALYAILVKGYGTDPSMVTFQSPQDLLGIDSDVSIWTNESKLWPLLNLAQILAPLPGIFLGVSSQRRGDSEEILFVLAIVSLVPVFASQISSLRYLGIAGMLFAVWRGYKIGDLQARSDGLI